MSAQSESQGLGAAIGSTFENRTAPELTIAELLTAPLMAGTRLLTPRVGLGRVVRAASVQEVPLEDFVRRDELVLTTAIGMGQADGGMADFIRQVAGSGASALAIAVPGHVKKISEAAILAAKQRGLPLIEVPWHVRFSDIVEFIFRRALDRQYFFVQRSQEINDLLTRIILNGAGVAQLCRSLSEMLGHSVRVFNRWDEEIGRAGVWPNRADGAGEWTSLAFTVGPRELGRIEVDFPSSKLTDLDARVIEQGLTAAALIVLREEAAASGAARGRAEFLTALLYGWIENDHDLELRANAIGVSSERVHVVVSLEVDAIKNSDDAHEVGRWAVDRAAQARRMRIWQTWRGNEAALLVEAGDRKIEHYAVLLLDDAVRRVRMYHSGVVVTVGIGSEAATLRKLPDSFRHARAAMLLGKVMRGAGSVTSFGELGAYTTLFLTLGFDGASQAFDELITRSLGKILSYEDSTGLPLSDTLAALFDESGNVSATARRLGINRQSLIYRIARIESLSGLGLKSSSDRFALEMAIRARQAARAKDHA